MKKKSAVCRQVKIWNKSYYKLENICEEITKKVGSLSVGVHEHGSRPPPQKKKGQKLATQNIQKIHLL